MLHYFCFITEIAILQFFYEPNAFSDIDYKPSKFEAICMKVIPRTIYLYFTNYTKCTSC